MRVTLGRAEEYRGTIVKLRSELSRRIGFSALCRDVEPLPYAFYLFAWDTNGTEPVGMVEFFCHDQAFDSHAVSPYSQAFDLERIVPIDRILHLRALVIRDHENEPALLRRLGEAFAHIAGKLGARYLTAEPQLLEHAFLFRCAAPGAPRTARFHTEGTRRALSLISLAATSGVPGDARSAGAFSIDPLLQQTIRLRGRRALAGERKAAVRLDRLLPAHWVGVWQRQLRACAV
jgi:hypothetical protein